MNAQDTLSRVNAILEHPCVDSFTRGELEMLAEELTNQVRHDAAASSRKLKPTETLARLIKNADKANPRLQGAWVDENGCQCTCDGFRAFRLKHPLPLVGIPENVKKLELNEVFQPVIRDNINPLSLPTCDELKTFITLERTKAGNRKAPVYDFGDGLPCVNAVYLLDLLTVLPDAKVFVDSSADGIIHPIYAIGSDGDAILLPVRSPNKMAVLEKAKAHREMLRDAGISTTAKAHDNTLDLSTFARCFAAA